MRRRSNYRNNGKRAKAGEGITWARPTEVRRDLSPGSEWLVEVNGGACRAVVIGRGWSYSPQTYDAKGRLPRALARDAQVVVSHDRLPTQNGNGYAVAIYMYPTKYETVHLGTKLPTLVPVVINAPAFVEPWAGYVARKRAGISARNISERDAKTVAKALARSCGFNFIADGDSGDEDDVASHVSVERAWYAENTAAHVHVRFVGFATFARFAQMLNKAGVEFKDIEVHGNVAKATLTVGQSLRFLDEVQAYA